MVDHWVRSAAEYHAWVEQQVAYVGGYWEHTPDYVEYPVESTGAIELETVLEVQNPTRIILPDDFRLDVRFTVLFREYAVDVLSYRYHLSAEGRPQVWRYDKHKKSDFEKKHGTDCHLHTEHGTIEPTPLVDFDEVVLRALAETGRPAPPGPALWIPGAAPDPRGSL